MAWGDGGDGAARAGAALVVPYGRGSLARSLLPEWSGVRAPYRRRLWPAARPQARPCS